MLLKRASVEDSILRVAALGFLSQVCVMVYNALTGNGFILRKGFLGLYALAGGFLVITCYTCIVMLVWSLCPRKYKDHDNFM